MYFHILSGSEVFVTERETVALEYKTQNHENMGERNKKRKKTRGEQQEETKRRVRKQK